MENMTLYSGDRLSNCKRGKWVEADNPILYWRVFVGETRAIWSGDTHQYKTHAGLCRALRRIFPDWKEVETQIGREGPFHG